MSVRYEELDYRPTPMGVLSLRRRRLSPQDIDVFEIKLGDDFLMSSQFTASEVALAEMGLAACTGDKLDVVVGGLGLGYTARAVLGEARVNRLIVVETMEAVIDWHETGLLPLGPELCADARCRFVHGDFFALTASDAGFDPQASGRTHDAVLLDIDHSPDFLLDPRHAHFYEPEGLARMARRLKPGGVFALWSNDRPDEAFVQRLQGVFASARAEAVSFPNPLQGTEFTQTVYVAVSG